MSKRSLGVGEMSCAMLNYLYIVELGRFSPCSSVMYVKYTPSSHDENRLKLCDPVGNIYF